MSVCERETDKKKKDRAGEPKVKTEEKEQWNQAEGEQKGELAEQRQKVLHVCWFPACQAPVSQ